MGKCPRCRSGSRATTRSRSSSRSHDESRASSRGTARTRATLTTTASSSLDTWFPRSSRTRRAGPPMTTERLLATPCSTSGSIMASSSSLNRVATGLREREAWPTCRRGWPTARRYPAGTSLTTSSNSSRCCTCCSAVRPTISCSYAHAPRAFGTRGGQAPGASSAVSASPRTVFVSATVRLRTRRSMSSESICVSTFPASTDDERTLGGIASNSGPNWSSN